MFKKIYTNNLITENCYILYDNTNCFIVDPGGSYEKINKEINDLKLNVLGILLTHAHADHTGAINKFNCPIYLHEKEVDILKRTDLSLYDAFDVECPYDFRSLNIKRLKNNDVIMLNDKEIRVLYTPGHTIGSVCYLFENRLFSGDTLFLNSCGRTDLPTGSESMLAKSVVNLIDSLDDSVKVYPGHDENTTIKNEKINNSHYTYYKKFV